MRKVIFVGRLAIQWNFEREKLFADSKETERRRMMSTGTLEHEMNAEIEQLAREWHADAMGLPSGSWHKSSAAPPAAHAAPSEVVRGHPPPFPAKPSRLSAAPKSRLHDGEAWMARRKVAVEGQAQNQANARPKVSCT